MATSKLASLFVIPKNDRRRTFDEDENLPRLPLPDLNHTLDRYLDSLKPFLTVDEYENAKNLVEKFRSGVGRILHEKLVEKAQNERNWVEKWWEDVAYLEARVPLISGSMIGVLPKNVVSWTYGTEDDQIKHASAYGHQLVQFWNLIRCEKLLPNQTADKKTNFSMSQYKRLFNTARLPGDKKDSLVTYFKTAAEGQCSTNAIIICKGRLFSLNTVVEDGKMATPESWEKSLREIMNICRNSSNSCPVGILTCDDRSNWSKNRKRLKEISQKNSENLSIIDESMFVIVLDDDCPETDSEVANANISGNYCNRWMDKSMCILFYKNGRSGSLCDHTAFDGLVAIGCLQYVVTALEESAGSEREKEKIDKNDVIGARFEELTFDVDDALRREMVRLETETIKYKKNILITAHVFDDYGKLEMQRLKFHPDSFIQMCLQLAYVSFHGKPGPCYETATTRKFYNGRTETVRSCTTECLDWVASMLDTKHTNERRRELFEKAVKRHDELMSEARENKGCDRHLFGMYCVAVEEGMEIPELFLDSSYCKSGGGGNFVLSTSCTGYTPLGGGVAPMCVDGYGVFYNILPHSITFTISAYLNSRDTDAMKYFEYLKNSFRRTRELLISTRMSTSKL